MSQASITAEALLQALIDHRVISEKDLVALLGVDRHDLTLNRLEMALQVNSVISDRRLALLKGALAGSPALEDEDDVDIDDSIDPKVCKRHGILKVVRTRPTVLMVEDTDVNMEAARSILGVDDFDVWLMTAGQFASLWGQVYRERVRSRHDQKVSDIHEILDVAITDDASDLHMAVGQPPRLRIDGRLRPLRSRPVSADWMEEQLTMLVGPEKMAAAKTTFRIDDAISYGSARFRLNIAMNRQGLTLVARKLPTAIPTAEQLNLPSAIRRLSTLERGLVVVTGPTGSGKSTTLAALVNEVISEPKHIITLEDPIEFFFESSPHGGLVNQRQLHEHFTDFSDAIKSALRQDPDVILVGEMRDLETMRTAITAAETGHLVFGTLHTMGADTTVARLINQFPAEEQNQVRAQLATTLQGVVAQSLLPRKNGKGRVAAFEVMVANPAVRNNLRTVEGMKHLRNTMATGVREGMQTIEMALVDLVVRGLVDEDEARLRARDEKDFYARLEEARGGGGR